MDPKLKQSIDNINSLNVSPEEKTALFGKLMEGVKAQYPPAPPMNTQQGFNVADMNAAKQGGGPLSTTMQDQSQPTFSEDLDPNFWSNVPLIGPAKKFWNNIQGSIPTDVADNPVIANLLNQAGAAGFIQKNDGSIDMTATQNNIGRNANLAQQPVPMQQTRPPMPVNPNVQQRQMPQMPPMPPPQLPPPRRTPSKWDLMKESMFAGEDQQGLFGKAGIDPRTGQDRGSMGLSGAFGRLFDNPNRMAMLQGGLTALDPSSYYDREGFQSPWTGLRASMGAAGRGYQGVKKQQMDERESASNIALAGAKTLKNMNALEVDEALIRTKHSSIVGNNFVDKYQMALDIKGGMSQKDALNKNSFQFGSSAYERKNADINKKTDASIARIEQLLNDPNGIDWNTVGWPGAIKELFETGAGLTGIDTNMEAGKVRLTANWIQSMAWRDLVGSGQLSVADYDRLQDMLGTRGLRDTPQKVRFKFKEAMQFLKDTRKGAGTYLRRNTNPDGTGKLPIRGAPDLSILYDDDVWSPEDQGISDLYNNF